MHMMALPPPSWPQGPSLLYTNTSAHGAVVYSSDDPCGHHAPLRSSCALAVIMRPCGHHGGHHAPLRSSCALAAIMEVIIRPCGHHACERPLCCGWVITLGEVCVWPSEAVVARLVSLARVVGDGWRGGRR